MSNQASSIDGTDGRGPVRDGIAYVLDGITYAYRAGRANDRVRMLRVATAKGATALACITNGRAMWQDASTGALI